MLARALEGWQGVNRSVGRVAGCWQERREDVRVLAGASGVWQEVLTCEGRRPEGERRRVKFIDVCGGSSRPRIILWQHEATDCVQMNTMTGAT